MRLFGEQFIETIGGIELSRLRSEQVRILHASLPISLTTTIIIAVVLVLLQWNATSAGQVMTWFLSVMAVVCLRYYWYFKFNKKSHSLFLAYTSWLVRFNLGVILSGLLWGSTAFLLFPTGNVLHQMFLLLILAGMSAGAVSTLSAYSFSIHAFLVLTLLPFCFRLLWEGGEYGYLLSAINLLFLIMINLSARRVAANIKSAMVSRFAHERALQELRESTEQNKLLLESVAEGIFGTDMDGITTFVNPAAAKMLGYKPEELIGKPMHTMIHYQRPDGTHYPRNECPMMATIEEGKVYQLGDEVLWHKNGNPLPVEYSSTPIIKDGGVAGAVVTFSDVSARKKAEAQLERQAFYDGLTDLPNRRLLLDRMEQAVANSRRHQHVGALLFLDLDQFKMINDSLGHHVGDALLRRVAERLKDTVRSEDTAARMGGDEFVILFTEISDDPETTANFSREVAEKIRQRISEPFHFGGHTLHVTPSIGIALFPLGDEGADEILMQADTAMYRAKELGRNGVQFYLPSMQMHAEERLAMQNDMRLALARDEFFLCYQPQYDVHGQITGAEALIRWHRPKHGVISPVEFIPLAEETGLILSVGEWVLQTTCELLSRYADATKNDYIPCIAVNVSPHQFRQADFVEKIQGFLQRSGVEPSRLELELTEGMLLADVQDTIAKMMALKELGVRFSIDDFGTGYSSLAYLKNLPLNKLKIDQSFIQDVPDDEGGVAIVETIIVMTKHLGLDVIAEGVESESQRDALIDMGCGQFQGYLYSRPVDESTLLQRLKQSRGTRESGAIIV